MSSIQTTSVECRGNTKTGEDCGAGMEIQVSFEESENEEVTFTLYHCPVCGNSCSTLVVTRRF